MCAVRRVELFQNVADVHLDRVFLHVQLGGDQLIGLALAQKIDNRKLARGEVQIELLFRWIKQHLHIRRFLGNNDNAIRLQLFAAMIAYALLRVAARSHCIKISILRFTDLVALCLFERRPIGAIDKPPPVNPSDSRLSAAFSRSHVSVAFFLPARQWPARWCVGRSGRGERLVSGCPARPLEDYHLPYGTAP
jgi:hypothetical protein